MRYFIANFKMYSTREMLLSFLEKVDVKKNDDLFVGIAIGDVYLQHYRKLFKEKGFEVLGQNVHYEENGAFTGNISVLQLKDIGVKYALIGHSETRVYIGQDEVNERTRRALKYGMRTVLCIGEPLETYEGMKSEAYLKNQLSMIKTFDHLDHLIIAYEPIYAIGKKIASSEHIEKMIHMIKSHLKEETGFNIPVVYGGSVSPNNIANVLNIKGIDGVLVGKASIDPVSFNEIMSQFGK
ncbi:triose-phosphate isomerase [Ureaplasma canigenitalium]|uniref:triose-phosphate isomerase n=1 Tax=Ureaplasma canigenitalium TaxID=42092 RepID=UPI0004E2392A|nr:triose-phosphate isomerase family protein [Ureaplasma canigenitalium]